MKQFLNITKKDYKFGSFDRSKFKDYQLYKRYAFFEISLYHKHGKLIFKDDWMEELLKNGIITECTYDRYVDIVKRSMMRKPEQWDLTNEQLYKMIHKHRKKFLDTEQVRQFKLNQLQQCSKPELNRGSIFQSDILKMLIYTNDSVLIAINDPFWLWTALEHTMSFLRQGKQVFFMTKGSSSSPLLDIDGIISLISGITTELSVYMKDRKLQFLKDDYDGRGIDFRNIIVVDELQAAVTQGNIFFCGFGEDIFLSIHDLAIPSMVYTQARTLYARSILNDYQSGRCYLVFIPAYFNIYQYVSLIESPVITYRHLSALSDQYGLDVYKKSVSFLYDRYPQYFVNFFTDVPTIDCQLMLQGDLREIAWDNIGSVAESRVKFVRKLMEGNQTYKSFSVYHDYMYDVSRSDHMSCGFTTHESVSVVPKGWENKTLINGLLIEDASRAKVLYVGDYNGLSFRRYMRRNGLLEKPAYMVNFMFFTTVGLIEKYNALRRTRPQEQIPVEYMHIDFCYEKEKYGARQSFPLYNKACIAKTTSGNFYFFRFLLGSGRICYKGNIFEWEEKDVNPINPLEVAVYTPYLSCKDEEVYSEIYTKGVGEGRLNLVIIGEKVVCIRMGEVLLPSIGVVVSLEKRRGALLWQHIYAKADEDGYIVGENSHVYIDLAPPKGLGPSGWDGIEWSYGGGITMIQDSVSIYDQDSNQSFREEGWLSPLSAQTQESQVHDETEQHPRTMLGITEKGNMFVLVFSGRSRFTRGVTYEEACLLAKKYIGDVRFMMAVDGGASSFIGFAGWNTFMELNYPACTEETGTGVVRPVNSLLLL